MTLHAPAHHAGFAGHHVLRDLLAVIVVLALALLALLAAPMIRVEVGPAPLSAEQLSLLEFRAGERLSWMETTSEDASLLQFRAGERADR